MNRKRSPLHRFHIIFTFFLIEFTFFFGGGILVLLVFGNQVVHVGFSLSEFHLVHTFTSVPVEEGLSSEHTSEILGNTLEHFLNSGGVTQETDSHLQTLRRDITDGRFDVIWDPFNEVGTVFVLNVQHLFINFLGGHTSTEQSASGQITSVTRVSSAHHILSIEHLLSQFRDS